MVTRRTVPGIGVLGTLTRDTTVYADGSRTENLGGLFYTLLTLAHLCRGAARIVPIANVGEDLFETVRSELQLPGLDLSLLRRVPQPNNHVHLTYRSPETRDEVLVGLVPPVDLEHVSRALDMEHLLVNLTSGRDVELETLQSLRRRFAGVLQLDIHSLTLDIAPGGWRVLRRPEAWKSWVGCADWVQMNETEAQLLGEGASLEAFAASLLELGPRGVLVTLGAQGCLARWREGGGTRRLALDADHHPPVPYTTGCGDVFGAAFAYGLVSGTSIENAVRLANAVASTKACFESYAELAHLPQRAAESLTRYLPA